MHRNTLLKKMENYEAFEQEKEFKSRIISFVKKHKDCFERSLEIGHITASCWLLNNDHTKALLMHHTKLDMWVQPGGHCDGDSDVVAVALKEAREESGIQGIEPGNMVEAYHRLLTSENENIRLTAALAWSRWEAATSKLEDDGSLTSTFEDPKLALSFARIENHYFRNGIFMPSDDYLLREVVKLRGIPTRIIQGRYDMVCPIGTAWELKKTINLPN